MRRTVVIALLGALAGAHPALAAHCRYDRIAFIYGQDSQGHIVAPAAVPCHIFFKSGRDRSEWSIAQPPGHGTLASVGDRGWNYMPARGYTGPDSFAVEVSGETMGRYVHSGSSKVSFAVDVVP